MTYYTNEASLRAAFAEVEVTALLRGANGVVSAARLEKAAGWAFSVVNNYLRSAGYVLPLLFSEFGVELEDGDDPLLDGQIQHASDMLSAYLLSQSADLNKEVYTKGYEDTIAWLKTVLENPVRLDLPRTEEPTGTGQVAIQTRPRVFERNSKTPDDYLRSQESE